jgi:hypothetical protein
VKAMIALAEASFARRSQSAGGAGPVLGPALDVAMLVYLIVNQHGKATQVAPGP